MKLYREYFKWPLDLLISLLLLILLTPIVFILCVILFFINRGNPFFVQARPGLNGKIFFLIKFKTMTDDKDESGILKSDEGRMTKFGSFLRKTSLDEIPQLFNVAKGDMSLIGPRPLLTEYLPLYNQFQVRRHEVRPGITGFAQINGRNALSWEQKFAYDVWYVDNLTFYLDCKILIKTIYKVSGSQGISSGTSVTMEKFNGNQIL